MARGKMDQELLALARASKHIEELEDPRAQSRVATYLMMRYTAAGEQNLPSEERAKLSFGEDAPDPRQLVIPGTVPGPTADTAPTRPATTTERRPATLPATPPVPGPERPAVAAEPAPEPTPEPAPEPTPEPASARRRPKQERIKLHERIVAVPDSELEEEVEVEI